MIEALTRGLSNPILLPYLAARRRGAGPSLTRADVVSDADWYASRFYQDYQAPSKADATLYCILRQPGGDGREVGLVLVRPLGERDFLPRDRTVVQAVAAEVTALIGGPLAKLDEPSPAALPPRLRQVLRCLLEGDADKQVAARLGLTRHTVNQYTKVVFRHFGVGSRAELLARWVRRGWGGRFAWADESGTAGERPAVSPSTGKRLVSPGGGVSDRQRDDPSQAPVPTRLPAPAIVSPRDRPGAGGGVCR
jgi:DNA-binding CsgD family transcriptional regulator